MIYIVFKVKNYLKLINKLKENTNERKIQDNQYQKISLQILGFIVGYLNTRAIKNTLGWIKAGYMDVKNAINSANDDEKRAHIEKAFKKVIKSWDNAKKTPQSTKDALINAVDDSILEYIKNGFLSEEFMDSKNIPYSESEYYDKESYKKIGNDKTTLNSKRACYISNENFHARRYAEISLNKLKEKQKKQEEKRKKS